MIRTQTSQAVLAAAAVTVALTVPAAANPQPEQLTINSNFVGVGEAPEEDGSAVTFIGDSHGNYVTLWATDTDGLTQMPLIVGRALTHTETGRARTILTDHKNSGGWWACTTTAKRPTIYDDDSVSGLVKQFCTGTAFKEHKLTGQLQLQSGSFWDEKKRVAKSWSTAREIRVNMSIECTNYNPHFWRTWAQGKIRYYNNTIKGYGEKYLRIKKSAVAAGDCGA